MRSGELDKKELEINNQSFIAKLSAHILQHIQDIRTQVMKVMEEKITKIGSIALAFSGNTNTIPSNGVSFKTGDVSVISTESILKMQIITQLKEEICLHQMRFKGITPKMPQLEAKILHKEGRHKKSAKMHYEAAEQALVLGQLSVAASEYMEMARQYTIRTIEQGKSISQAYASYLLAISYYNQADRTELANNCRVELAKLYEIQGEYILAAGIYYEAGNQEKALDMWKCSQIEYISHE